MNETEMAKYIYTHIGSRLRPRRVRTIRKAKAKGLLLKTRPRAALREKTLTIYSGWRERKVAGSFLATNTAEGRALPPHICIAAKLIMIRYRYEWWSFVEKIKLHIFLFSDRCVSFGIYLLICDVDTLDSSTGTTVPYLMAP